MEKRLPIRKRNRLINYDYSSYGAYFITICTKDKKKLFWESGYDSFVGEDNILPYTDSYGCRANETLRFKKYRIFSLAKILSRSYCAKYKRV